MICDRSGVQELAVRDIRGGSVTAGPRDGEDRPAGPTAPSGNGYRAKGTLRVGLDRQIAGKRSLAPLSLEPRTRPVSRSRTGTWRSSPTAPDPP